MSVNNNWGRCCALTVDHTKVSGMVTNFPVCLVWTGSSSTSNLPAEMITTGNANAAKSDGGDIRFTSDSAGTTELPLEIAAFSQNSSSAAARAELWVKVPSISAATDTVIYLWYKNSSASGYAIDASYGRNAVWSSYKAVYHLSESSGSAIDSLGVSNGTYSGTSFPNRVDSPKGYGQQFLNSNSRYITLANESNFDYTNDFCISAMFTANFVTDSECLINKGGGSGELVAYTITRYSNSGSTMWAGCRYISGGNNDSAQGTTNVNDGAWRHLSLNFVKGTGVYSYINGTLDHSVLTTYKDSDTRTNNANVLIGNYYGTSRYWNGKIAEVRFSPYGTSRSAAWIGAESNSVVSPYTFVAAGTPVNTQSAKGNFLMMF